MPEQQQNASFLKKVGGNRLAAINEALRDKPPDLRGASLPAGIKEGVAKLSACYTKEQTEEGKKVPKGGVFFRVSAIAMAPEYHTDGQKIAGCITQQVIPLCDIPAKGFSKAQTFEENFDKFRSILQSLGIAPCPETKATDPTGERAEAYWLAAVRLLGTPGRPPVYLKFSTRGFTPAKSPQNPNPTEMVFEDWHGLATPEDVARLLGGDGKPDPAGGVSAPPLASGPPTPPVPAATPSTNGIMRDVAADAAAADLNAEVSELVEMAMNDPQGGTEDGAYASKRLEELALQVGWTLDDVSKASDWASVGDMALHPPTASDSTAPTTPTVGSKWLFAKRTKDGAKLANKDGAPFPSLEVEVTAVNSDGTVFVKTVRDNRDVVEIRSKKPTPIKWEWLETVGAPPY